MQNPRTPGAGITGAANSLGGDAQSPTVAGSPPQALAAPRVRILDWRELRSNHLLGFAKIELPSGLVINDVCILAGERGPWASPPAKPQVDRDGNVVRESNGKLRYSPVIEFRDKETRNRWSDAVIEAVRTAHPDALE
jgi:hypothetical protein